MEFRVALRFRSAAEKDGSRDAGWMAEGDARPDAPRGLLMEKEWLRVIPGVLWVGITDQDWDRDRMEDMLQRTRLCRRDNDNDDICLKLESLICSTFSITLQDLFVCSPSVCICTPCISNMRLLIGRRRGAHAPLLNPPTITQPHPLSSLQLCATPRSCPPFYCPPLPSSPRTALPRPPPLIAWRAHDL